MKGFNISGKYYKTKKELQEVCKRILNTNFNRDYLEGEDLNIILDVLKMHERYREKVGCGIKYISTITCPINPRNNHFILIREDGSEEDFSYVKCISKFSVETRLKSVLRKVITGQTKSYKDNYFKSNADKKGYVLCNETGLKIKKKDAHLDHFPKTFEEIVYDWFLLNDLKIKDFNMTPPTGMGYHWDIQDEKQVNSFYNYHKEVAEYRVVLDKVNLQRLRPKKFKLPT